MADELPAIEIDGEQYYPLVAGNFEGRSMTLPDLCALVAALPDEQRLKLFAGLWEKGAEMPDWARHICERSDSLYRQQFDEARSNGWLVSLRDAESALTSERQAHERTKAELAEAREELFRANEEMEKSR